MFVDFDFESSSRGVTVWSKGFDYTNRLYSFCMLALLHVQSSNFIPCSDYSFLLNKTCIFYNDYKVLYYLFHGMLFTFFISIVTAYPI